MLDGRHTGTGGGNHIVLGGPTPPTARPAPPRPAAQPDRLLAQSSVAVVPVFRPVRRPDQPGAAHRRGPQRQPLRNGNRLPQIPDTAASRPGSSIASSATCLIDVTGNTHRAEFCIDKLYSPDSASGRLGLVELRAFEMPPHARMSLVQQLLLRGLIARFWKHPYQAEARALGNANCTIASCCRTSSRRISAMCLAELRQAGYRLREEWFAPHLEFRFPLLGSIAPRRRACWNCGRRSSPGMSWARKRRGRRHGALCRFVGRTACRSRCSGLIDPRHVVTCNGRRVPLHPTGTNGEFVAGVRYRAWQPPSCLHPTIPCMRRWSSIFSTPGWSARWAAAAIMLRIRADGRTTRSRSTPTRRKAGGSSRFFAMGHTPGRMMPASAEPNSRSAVDARSAASSPETAHQLCRLERGTTRPISAMMNGKPRRRSNDCPRRDIPHEHDLFSRIRPRASASVLGSYAGLDSAYDELIASGWRRLRPHWQTFAQGLDEIGLDEFTNRWDEAQQLIRENGVTYNVYGDPRGMDRPWQLDPIPLVISPPKANSADAASSSGPAARSRCSPIFTARSNCSRWVCCRPNWFSPIPAFCVPVTASACRAIVICIWWRSTWAAVPTARSTFSAIAPRRRRAPATPWRIASCCRRMLPEVFQACQVQRLALFFRTFRDTLRRPRPA